jgi:hypothetical protein
VLRIRDVHPGSVFFSLDPESVLFIPDLDFFIPDPGSGFFMPDMDPQR